MENTTKPKLVFFQGKPEGISKFVLLHKQQHVKCLSEFFEVIVISEDCDYQQICDNYQPDLTLFESGVNYRRCQKLKITNTHTYLEIPKLGLHNGDPWCEARAGFLSDMEYWGIETFFSIGTTTAEHTPAIAENFFAWPNFVDANIYRDYGESKIVPILFTGYIHNLYPWRQRINKIVSQSYPSLICPHLGYEEGLLSRMMHGEQYARTINASWFVPTCGTVAKDVVRKHFEIPASKSCLITEKTPALEACGFIDMDNCVFADENDVLDKLDYLFQNRDELERITNAGYQLVHCRHTLKQRDQIFQWFNLYKNLKLHQKIVQTNPFGTLIIVENSSEIKNSHVVCNGLDIVLLRQGDKQLWAGQYNEAEALYLKCLNHISWMPEPKLGLALCNLYKGNTEAAFYWITQPIKYTLEDYKALDPDPVEWAYFIISLLCQGKLNDAINRANQFPSLCHPELNRTRWVVDILKHKGDKDSLPYSDPLKCRYSVHQLPSRSLNDWVYHLCIMLKSCKQIHFIRILDNSFLSENQLSNKLRFIFSSITTQPLIKFLSSLYSACVEKLNKAFIKVDNAEQILSLSITSERKYIKLSRQIKSKLRKFFLNPLNYLETRVGYFLPYRFSMIKKDEFFCAIQKLTREEDIKTALVIGASAGKGSTQAFLSGIRENPNKPTVFCVNTSTPQFIKLQKRYASDSFIRCYDVSSVSLEHIPSEKTENGIKKIKQEHEINFFDVLLIDGSEFSDFAESDELYKSRFILLDDINTFHNYKNYQKLLTEPNYKMVIQNICLRKGYAIFQRVSNNKLPFDRGSLYSTEMLESTP